MTQQNSGDSGKPGEPEASGSKPDDSGSKPVDARIARRRQDALGRRLRQMYDSVVSEPVPDEFMSFLHDADARTPKTGKSGE